MMKNVNRNDMIIVCVIDERLMFGCMKARCELSGNNLILMVYDSPRRLYSVSTPNKGDRFLCYREHASVVVPVYYMNMNNWLLRQTKIPHDVTQTYFPPFVLVNFASPAMHSILSPI